MNRDEKHVVFALATMACDMENGSVSFFLNPYGFEKVVFNKDIDFYELCYTDGSRINLADILDEPRLAERLLKVIKAKKLDAEWDARFIAYMDQQLQNS